MHLFIDDEKILSKLSEKGNPLERLDAVMDWTILLSLLSELFILFENQNQTLLT